MKPVRVLIVDDHPVVRQGLQAMLRPAPEIEIVGESDDALHALQLAGELRPDVVLTDIRMPALSGIELAARLYTLHPEIAVVLLTNYSDRDLMRGGFQARARGYLLKTATLDELVDALQRVAQGERVVATELVDGLLDEYTTLVHEHVQHASGLTGDEVRVLQQMAAGLSNHAIARLEFVSEATIKRRAHDIYQKLGVTDRAQAIAAAVRQGVL